MGKVHSVVESFQHPVPWWVHPIDSHVAVRHGVAVWAKLGSYGLGFRVLF